MMEQLKHIFDGVNMAAIVGTLMGYLPDVTAVLSLVWVVIRIYETKTVQKMLGRPTEPLGDYPRE